MRDLRILVPAEIFPDSSPDEIASEIHLMVERAWATRRLIDAAEEYGNPKAVKGFIDEFLDLHGDQGFDVDQLQDDLISGIYLPC